MSPPSLDLDALERDGAPGSFTITHGGEQYALADPQELDWRQIDRLGTVSMDQDLRTVLGDQYEQFARTPLPGWKLDKLIAAWREHYGLDQGEADASST